MGKITGFLEIDRHDRKYAPVDERIKSYREFVVPLSEKDTRDQAARCMNCGIPYCHGTGSVAPGTPGCPVNNQIPDFNDLVYAGNWEEASRNLHSTNNFPEFTGRICPAPCGASRTPKIDDKPVTIKTIECAIVDRAWDNGWLKPEIPAHKTGKKVAVVGSGPAGLACAQPLARALPIPGRELSGIHFAMDFLPQQNRRVSEEPLGNAADILAGGKHVVVIGGGDPGSDWS